MDRKEAEEKISDIFFRALTSKISEKQMHDEIKLVLKELDSSRIHLKINPERFDD